MRRNQTKALELWHRAGELLGYAKAYGNIGYAYRNGDSVERDAEKAENYYELAAMKGCAEARHNLGCAEAAWDRALKHYMVSVGDGDNDSVKNIKQLYMDGHAKKEDYVRALRAYQGYLKEVSCCIR